MARPDRYFDWQSLPDEHAESGPATDPRGRLRLLFLLFAILLTVAASRVVSLEISYGDAFRAEADKPLERRLRIAAVRGRILAADGTVLACDEPVLALAVKYRTLEEPANADWLRRQARARLPRSAWRDPRQLAESEQQVLAERRELLHRLAEICNVSPENLRTAAAQVQARVMRIAREVNQRRQAAWDEERRTPGTENQAVGWRRWWQAVEDVFFAVDESAASTPITVREELEDHIVCEGVTLSAVAEIEGHPERYPGVRIVERSVRRYPAGSLASHVIGHLGLPSEEDIAAVRASGEFDRNDRVGRMGAERQFERLLQGRTGISVEQTDRRGRRLGTIVERRSVPGRDVILSLDVPLQRAAEDLLDAALARRDASGAAATRAAGGAVVVMDVQSGQVLAVASGPRFDPSRLAEPAAAGPFLSDPAKPLFDRSIKMALPPGSVFKTLSAVALLESGTVEADTEFVCQGFFQHPDRERCLIFRRRGVGHGPIDLGTALAQSCNVYFYHFAAEMGPVPLIDWTMRFGFGQRTGIDLPDEARGFVPTPANTSAWSKGSWSPAETRALAIGQSALTVTPLQIARLMAAVANGGRLVTPRIGRWLGLSTGDTDSQSDDQDLAAVAPARDGLQRVVADPSGTAHATVYLDSLSIAGKTGTAETGGGQADHAWFAGYAPADQPKVAFVVVLEHAGGGSDAAGPVARRLMAKMLKLGYFDHGQLAHDAQAAADAPSR